MVATKEQRDKRVKSIMPKIKKQFDVVIMNPPYQPATKKNSKDGGSGSRNTIWDKFVHLALDLVPDNGFVAAIHPVKWRKPEDAMYSVITGNRIHYLEMHTKQDGIKTFGASTPYDWYVLQKASSNGEVTVKDTNGKTHRLDLSSFPFLPNFDLKFVQSLLAGPNDEKCPILYSRSAYGNDKRWMSKEKNDKFKHPCIRSTGVKSGGMSLLYSSKRAEFFGEPKVVFGDADVISNVVIDMRGDYAITDHGLAIKVKSTREAQKIKKALESERFSDLLKSCRWSQFQIDWKMFALFRRDFYKEFV